MAEDLVKLDSLEALEVYLRDRSPIRSEDVHGSWGVVPTWIPNLVYTVRVKELLAGDYAGNGLTMPEGLEPSDAVTAENFWVIREAARFEFGIYKRKISAHFERLRGLRPDLWWHFVHQSLDDPSMVAYTPSHEYGKRDRQVRVKVGRYLTQFYSEHFSPEDIRAIVNQCKPLEVKFAVTAEEIAEVYVNGPSSCMSGEWDSRHPSEVYAGEFRLGYIQEGERIVARGLVHDPSKTWVRVYGDEGQTLADSFDAMGFRKVDSWPSGAKLKRIEDRRGRVLMPYIDGDVKSVDEHGAHFVIRDCGDYSCSGTSGYLEDERPECDNCGARYDEDDGSYSEYHDMRICSSCADGDFVYAYTSSRYQDYVRTEEVVEVSGEYYVNDTSVLSEHDIQECAYSCEYFHIEDMVLTVDDEWVHSDYALCVGTDEHDEQKYASIGDIDLHYTVHFDPTQNTVLMLVHPDFHVDTHTRELFPETMRTLKLGDFLTEYVPAAVQWRDGLMPYKRGQFMNHVAALHNTVMRDQPLAA